MTSGAYGEHGWPIKSGSGVRLQNPEVLVFNHIPPRPPMRRNVPDRLDSLLLLPCIVAGLVLGSAIGWFGWKAKWG